MIVESGPDGGRAFAGGTNCSPVDFCIQGAGQSFADALAGWHAKAAGKQVIDMGYHMAVTDLGFPGALEELVATLPEQGVTSYKLFMAYKNALMVDDATLFETMEVAAKTGALVMVHAENGEDVIDVLVRRALAAWPHGTSLACAHPSRGDGGRGHQPGDPARAGRRRAALCRPRLVQGGRRTDRVGACEGLEGVGRDLHPVLLR